MGKRKFVGYFVIYHIPGIKIGCTVNYRKRCKQYGVDELEIIDLVSLACGDVFAGAVEWAWADYFGYPRKQHYRHNWNNSQTTDQKRIAGVRGSRKAKTNHKWPAAMRKLAANTEYQAVHAEAMCKLSADPVWQEAQAERNRKLAADPNWRAVHAKATAESNRRLAKDPKWQKANAEGRRKLRANPKWRVAVTEANRKLHADPDYQATCLKAMRKLQAIIHTCDWCDKVGKGTSMKRHHFNNCLLNPDAPRPVSRWTRIPTSALRSSIRRLVPIRAEPASLRSMFIVWGIRPHSRAFAYSIRHSESGGRMSTSSTRSSPGRSSGSYSMRIGLRRVSGKGGAGTPRSRSHA